MYAMAAHSSCMRQVITPKGQKTYPVPCELHASELPGYIELYRQGARNALAAGFDGVEIHNANGMRTVICCCSLGLRHVQGPYAAYTHQLGSGHDS